MRMQGYSGDHEIPGKAERMIRHWIKLLLLTLLVLIQTACPKYAPKQPDEMNVHVPDEHGSSDSG